MACITFLSLTDLASTCQIEEGVAYNGYDLNNGLLSPTHRDGESCRHYCSNNFPSARYFTYITTSANTLSNYKQTCWCKLSNATRELFGGKVSGEIDCAYSLVTSGNSCGRIKSKAGCEQAARQLGLSDTEASEENVSDYPPYCYIYDGKKLWFNTNGDSPSGCNSDEACICISASTTASQGRNKS